MKTDDLITLLARDTTQVKRAALPMRIGMFALLGAAVAFGILLVWLGVRPDLAEAAGGMTYWMKTLYTLGMGIAGFALVERLSRPGAKGMAGWVIAGVLAALMVAIAGMQLMATPADEMGPAFMGSSWDKCPWRILALSLPGLVIGIAVMRRLAPTRPALSGGAIGLLAGGLAATVYGLFCEETAAAFVAVWYSIGIALSVAVGALAGSRLLRW